MFQPPVLGSWWHRNHHLVSTGIDIDIHFQLSLFLFFVPPSPRIPLSTPSISSLKLITLVCCGSELFIQSFAIYMFLLLSHYSISLFLTSLCLRFLSFPRFSFISFTSTRTSMRTLHMRTQVFVIDTYYIWLVISRLRRSEGVYWRYTILSKNNCRRFSDDCSNDGDGHSLGLQSESGPLLGLGYDRSLLHF